MSLRRFAQQLFSTPNCKSKRKRTKTLRHVHSRPEPRLGLESLESRLAMAFDATLVTDILAGGVGSNPSSFVDVNGILFFQANGPEGVELWKSDGTPAGTSLVKDIQAGPLSSNPRSLTDVNGTLYFVANDGVSGDELWKSDGTEAGTVPVADIVSGLASSNPVNLTASNGLLFFTATDTTSGTELWKSDGTAAGTVPVLDIVSGSGSSSPRNLLDINGTLFFVATDGATGFELWKSDGLAAGTVPVRDISTGASSSDPAYLTNVNGTLFFQARDVATGVELWKSDGSLAGTVQVSDLVTGPISSNPRFLTNVNGTLYFAASNATTGFELWKSGGSAATTVPVRDIFTGPTGSDPRNLTNVDGTLYFVASNGVNGRELWKSDGSFAGTVPVKDIFLGAGSSDPSSLTNINGTLFFSASDGISGTELWVSDGTNAGTVLVEDIEPLGNSFPRYLTNVNGTLFLTANDVATGSELWVVPAVDYGDAPAPFPTLDSANGARHFSLGATLGANRDGELDGQPAAGALGDDLAGSDDEDGLISQSVFQAGAAGSVTLNVQGVVGTYHLSGWIDFNRDGDWTDPGEKIATDVPVTANGNVVLNFTVPNAALLGLTFSRFRLSSQTGLRLTGPAPDGEVEDHQVSISPPLDLAVSQIESVDPVEAGSGVSNLTYVVTVKNNGVTNATGVVLSQDLTLPTGVSFVSATPSVGSYSVDANSDGTWNLGNLAVGDIATLTLNLTVDVLAAVGTDVISSTATVTASNQTLVNTADDTVTTLTSILDRLSAVITGPTSVGEGLSITLDGSQSSDVGAPAVTITVFEWDLDFDGTTFNTTAAGPTVQFDAAGIDGPSSRVVALRVTNSLGTVLPISTRTISILNRDLTLDTFTVPSTVTINSPLNLAATASDPAGIGSDPITFTWTITRPDLQTFTLTGANPSFSPGLVGQFGVSLTVSDGDGSSATSPTATVNVVAAPNNVQARVENNQLIVIGDNLANQIRLDLGAGGVKDTFRLTGLNGTTINGLANPFGAGGISQGVSIQLAGGDDVITVTGRNVKLPIVLDGAAGNDRYVLSALGTNYVISDSDGIDTLDFSGQTKAIKVDLAKSAGENQTLGNGNKARIIGQIENVIGSQFNDSIKGNALNNRLEGGAGKDKIDGREGNDLIFGGGGNDSLIGGLGNDVLVGGADNDTLKASEGFDVLIGGNGIDKITGGKLGNSLLIGGSTTHDANDAALLAILGEWSRLVAGVPASLGSRIANLQNGVGPGNTIKLTTTPPATVLEDAFSDTLKTLGINNWTFVGVGDKRTGVIPGGAET